MLRIMDITSNDVKDILRDVNHFLTETLQNETLSSSAVVAKEELLKKIFSLPEIATPYLDMSCSTKSTKESADYVPLNVNEYRVDSQLYEEFPNQTLCYTLPPEENQDEFIIKYLILPASKLRFAAKKFGQLCRKEKFMGLFVERSIRCWVGILGDILYIYNSDRDPKPASFVNIQGFEARPAVNFNPKDAKKRECCFELVCPGRKSLQFVACSVKDMEQWIMCVNEVSSQVNKGNGNVMVKERRLPSPPPKTNGALEYDDIGALNCEAKEKCEVKKEKIYHNLKSLSIKDESLVTKPSQQGFSAKLSEHELVYDDICGINSSLYYNVIEKDQITERVTECDGNSIKGNAFGYSDEEDIYDDIGITSVTPETLVLTNLIDKESINTSSHISKSADIPRGSKYQTLNQIVHETNCSKLENSIHCNDNLYEPVDNPRDE